MVTWPEPPLGTVFKITGGGIGTGMVIAQESEGLGPAVHPRISVMWFRNEIPTSVAMVVMR